MSVRYPVGAQFRAQRTISQFDLDEFARISGDDNPIHVDAAYAATTAFVLPVAHGMFLFSLVRARLREHWPKGRLSEQRLQFLAPTPVGSEVTITLRVLDNSADTVRVATEVTGSDGSIGLIGECVLSVKQGDGQ